MTLFHFRETAAKKPELTTIDLRVDLLDPELVQRYAARAEAFLDGGLGQYLFERRS